MILLSQGLTEAERTVVRGEKPPLIDQTEVDHLMKGLGIDFRAVLPKSLDEFYKKICLELQ